MAKYKKRERKKIWLNFRRRCNLMSIHDVKFQVHTDVHTNLHTHFDAYKI